MPLLPTLAFVLAPAPQITPEVLLTEGLPVPSDPTRTVGSINSSAVNSVGGWCVETNVSDGVDTLSAAYGTPDGSAAAILVEEDLYGGLQQTSWESFLGLDDGGNPAYSATSTDTGSGAAGLDGAWYSTVVVANEGDPVPPLPGLVYRFNSRVNVIAETGEPVWVAGLDDVGGADQGRFLMRGFGPTVVLATGDVLPGLAAPLGSAAIDFDFRFSPDGSHYATPCDTTEPSTSNTYVVVDGAGLSVGGLPVKEGGLLPASLQADPTESWDNFDYFGIGDDGEVLFTGNTDGPGATDEFLFLGDTIALREGDSVGGLVLSGAMESGYLGPRGDVGVVWDVDLPTAVNVEALLFNGRVLLIEGSAIEADVTGDGVPEVGAVSGFTGIASLTVGADRACYVTLDVDTAGTTSTTDDTELLVRVAVPDLLGSTDTLSVSAGGTVDFTLFTPRDVEADFYWLVGSTTGTAGIVADGVSVPLTLDGYTLFTVQQPNQAPLVKSFGAISDPFGVEDAAFSLPAGSDPSFAGTTVWHAYVTIGLTPFATVTHASNAWAFTLTP